MILQDLCHEDIAGKFFLSRKMLQGFWNRVIQIRSGGSESANLLTMEHRNLYALG
jgi:hypothetical protein